MATNLPLKLENLPRDLPRSQAVRLELVEEIPIFKASCQVQKRIESLLQKEKDFSLDDDESQELDDYEKLDDYLNLVNRTIRNLYISSER